MQLPAPAHIEITWQVAGILTGIIVAATGGMAKYVGYTVSTAIASLEGRLKLAAVLDRAKLIKELNGTYVHTPACTADMAIAKLEAHEAARALAIDETGKAKAIALEALRTARALEVDKRIVKLERHESEPHHNED